MKEILYDIQSAPPESTPVKPIVVYGGPLYDGKGGVFTDGAVYISKGKILAVGDETTVFGQIPRTTDMELYDTGGKVIFPGSINLHHHFYRAFAAGLFISQADSNYQEFLKNFWWKFDKCLDDEMVQLSTLFSVLQSIRSGVTSIFDLHSSPVCVHNILENTASVISRAGIRAVLSYEVSERDGDDVFVRGMEENLNFIRKYQDDDQIQGMFGLQANSTISEKSLSLIAEKLENKAGIHIHLGSARDTEFCKNLGYKGPVDRLNAFNLINPKSLLVNGPPLGVEDINKIVAEQAMLVTIPESLFPRQFDPFSLAGLPGLQIGAGTGGWGSNILQALRTGYYYHRQTGSENTQLIDFLKAQLQNNSDFAGRFFKGKSGVLEKNARADIVVFDYIPITPFNTDNYMHHLLFGMQSVQAAMVMAKGQFLYNDNTFLTLDEEIIIGESKKASRRLWELFNKL
ncbi:MAG TPA: hypothetical protein DHW42_03670 [Candidatus Marinimicrobia bacterium]|nr:hypothetical protein [Candidatus Neomarinimicrobiota bacterium]